MTFATAVSSLNPNTCLYISKLVAYQYENSCKVLVLTMGFLNHVFLEA